MRHHGGILDIPVAARLVQLVRAQSRPRRRRVGLYRVTLVEQVFPEQFAQQVPERLHVAVVVRDVGMIHVHPVPHHARQLLPLVGVPHHLLLAGIVELVYRDGLPDILLCYSQDLLHGQLHRQSVRVPARLALHLESPEGLVAAENILDRSRDDMVDARDAVCRGRPFIKDKFRMPFP